MAASDKQLPEKLKAAGTRLLSPPSSVDELLRILDEVQKILENVEQSPSETMQDALWPTRHALVSQELLGHSDPDVKVAVATCISEITRITAPDAPYSDDQMKDIFQLIVSSFEKLHDLSSRSYDKRTAILDIVAKVRSCVVMLDLECDNLILEMFQHFFNSVRDHHPEKVFSSMETIMTLVLEESEDISPELLSSILETLKKDNKNVDPIARRLGENVLNNCASKVKPYLLQAIKILEISLDDYSNVVASVCQQLSSDVDSNGVNIASINLVNQADLPNPSSENASKEVKETLDDTAPQAEVSPAPEKLESTMSNGNLKKGVEEPEAAKEHLPEQKCDDLIENKAAEESRTVKDEADLIIKPQPEEKSTKKRGRKGNMLKSTLKPCETTQAVDKDAEEVGNLQQRRSKDSESLQSEDTRADITTPPYSEKGPDNPHPSSKASENEALDVTSPAPIVDTTEESDSKKVDREMKAESVIQEVSTLPEDDSIKETEDSNKELEDSTKEPEDSIKEPEETNKEPEDSNKEPEDSNKEPEDSNKEPEDSNKEPEDSNKEPEDYASVSKADKITGQETSSVTDKEETILRSVDASRKGNRSTSDTKTTKMSGKRGESTSDQQTEKKIKGQGKAKSTKDRVKSPPLKERKESEPSPKTAKKSAKKEPFSSSSKRKRAAGKEKASGIDKYGEELVGSKVEVWWPKDKQFYEGVVDSFDPVNKKHRVVYIDGDIEILNMEKEKWHHIKDGEHSNKGYVSDGENPDASSEIRTKKKIKANPDLSNKPGNSVSAKKRVGSTSSSRSKVAVSKPGKSKKGNEVNVEKASNDEDSKDGGRSEDEKGEESSDASSGDESMNETPRGASKSKEGDAETPKTNPKSKQQTPKGNTRSKGKTAKVSASKSNANKTGKAKAGSSSSKGKESEKTKKSQNESAKPSQTGKSKTSSTPSKAQKSETSSGKKRKRGSTKK